MRMNLNLIQLRAFLAVADEGTFTDAAIRLGVSQASVSRAINGLEDALTVTLFHRTTREVALTTQGRAILAHARRIVTEVETLKSAASRAAAELRIGYAWAALGQHTTTVQRRWSERHPSATLLFVQSQTRMAGLADGTADIAVLRVPVDDHRFEVVAVGSERRVGAVCVNDPLAKRRSLTLTDLAKHTLAIDSTTGTTVPELWPPHDRPQHLRHTHTVEDWVNVIAAGHAVGMTTVATSKQFRHPDIAYRPMRDVPDVTVSLAWRRGEAPHHVHELVDVVREVFCFVAD